jgi:ribosomal protein S18 acetylase RimI-like enzyme
MRVSTDPAELDVPLIHRFLSNSSYWASGMPIQAVRKAIANSLCFGGFLGKEQIAFGRVATDFTRFGYLMDIFVLPAHRGKGYGKQLVAAMLERLEREGVGSVMLSTRDVDALYRSLGFELVGDLPKVMRRVAAAR